MFTMAELVAELNRLNLQGVSWAEISKKLYPFEDPELIRPTLWRIANKGYVPHERRLRKRLGLPPVKMVEECIDCGEVHLARCPKAMTSDAPSILSTGVVVIIGGGTIPPGCQVISASVCECGQPFISNHPARKRCFICSPFRKRSS